MKKAQVSRTSQQILFLLVCFSAAFFIGAICAGDYTGLLPGLWKIWTNPSQLTMDYFLLGGIGSTLLNTGLVGLACCLLLHFSQCECTGVTIAGYFLTVGFSSFGMTLPSILPFFFGTWVYARLKSMPLGTVANSAMFSTALAPFAGELMFRYPGTEAAGFSVAGMVFAILLGTFVGVVMPPLCTHTRGFHKYYNLYNAGPAAGFLSLALYCLLFRSSGIAAPTNTALGQGHRLFMTVFFLIVFLACIGAAFLMDRSAFSSYRKLWQNSDSYKDDFVSSYGIPCTLMNMGIYGLFILLYYSIIHGFSIVDGALTFAPALFTGPTVGSILCMYAFVAFGAYPKNVLPIIVGYFAASLIPFFLTLSGITESSSWTLTTQAMLVGVCFASGLAPISGRYGFLAGVIGGFLHALIVTTIPLLHGGFCLYNGGFTCGIVCFLMIPVMEHFFVTKEERRYLPHPNSVRNWFIDFKE